jgi:hypothetical protein
MAKKITPITAPTQKHLPIADITDDIVLTKDGGAALVLKSSALNFSLLSEQEQEALIFAYASLLNSLSFPVQILIRSHRKDVSRYLSFLKTKEAEQKNPKLKTLAQSYMSFVSQIVKKKNVLQKEFFIILRFSPLELGLSPVSLINLFSPAKIKRIPYPKSYVIKKAKTALYPKRDHLIRLSGRLGIRLQQMTTEELIALFSSIYKTNEPSNATS